LLAGLLTIATLVFTSSVQAEMLVAVVGDSNVYGKGISSSENYPTQLEQALKRKGHDVRVHNGGQNGDTTGGLLSRLSSAAPQGTQVAVVWIGVNDRKMLGADTAKIQAGRRAIAGALQARGIEVVTVASDAFIPLHMSPATSLPDHHLNRAGYSQVVARTLGQVEAAIGRAKKKKS
jgi:acyl-CoA thioesterase-1